MQPITERLAKSKLPIVWKKSQRTSTYLFTFDPFDKRHMEQVKKVKAEVSAWNRNREPGQPRRRVKTQYRLGPNSPFAYMYRKGGEHYRYISYVPRKHAGYADLYIHNDYS